MLDFAERRSKEEESDGISGRWINQRGWGVFQFVFENFFFFMKIDNRRFERDEEIKN